MQLLLDTHAALWWLAGDDQLSDEASEAIASSERPLFSAGTLMEVAIKASLGKLSVPDGWARQLLTEGFDLLPITPSHASALQGLPFVAIAGRLHRDPFDRLLVAQAQVERIPVVTRDAALAAHGVPTIW